MHHHFSEDTYLIKSTGFPTANAKAVTLYLSALQIQMHKCQADYELIFQQLQMISSPH